MKNKVFLSLTLLSLCTVFILGCSKVDDSKPNILFISIDSLRRDHLSCYGYFRETSPNIDRLAAKGTIFDNAISTTCWTLPSHMSMFTGLYNMQHGVNDDGKALNPAIKTLPQYMKEAGYYTFGIFAGPYLHPIFGFSRGFDEYIDCSNSKALARNVNEMERFMPRLGNMHTASHKDITGGKIYQAFSSWYKDKDEDKPYFAFVHMWDVHYDYIPPPPYDKLYDPDYQGLLKPHFANNKRLGPNMCSRDLEHLIALYDGEIKWTDFNLGKIIDLLTKSGDLENTLIIITADHGEEFLEHGRLGHDSLFDELIRIPMIIYYPKLFPNKKLPHQVSQIDLLPTILDVVNRDVPDYISGVSILDLLKRGFNPDRMLMSEYSSQPRNRLMISFRTVDWKFLYNVRIKKPMFFNFENDSKEEHSLIPLKPPIVLSDYVRKKLADSIKFYEEINETMEYFKSMETLKPELDEATKEHLKALGYLN